MQMIFVDMDGVLADFDRHHEAVLGWRPDKALDNVDWQQVRAVPDFYYHIPPMPDAHELWEYVRPYGPTVLTGVPNQLREEASRNKRAWVERHLGAVPVICCPSREKCLHARSGDVLIDDWEKYRHLWVARGGVWITHASAAKTIAALRELGL